MLVVKKYRDPEVSAYAQKLLVWLIEKMEFVVYLEQSALDEEFPPLPTEAKDLDKIYENIRVWQPPMQPGGLEMEGGEQYVAQQQTGEAADKGTEGCEDFFGGFLSADILSFFHSLLAFPFSFFLALGLLVLFSLYFFFLFFLFSFFFFFFFFFPFPFPFDYPRSSSQRGAH